MAGQLGLLVEDADAGGTGEQGQRLSDVGVGDRVEIHPGALERKRRALASDNRVLSVIVFPARAGMKAARATLSASLPTRSPRPGSLPPAR